MAGRFFPVQGLHLGPTGAYASFIQTDLSNLYPGQLGQSAEDNGAVYKLVKVLNTAGVLTAAGDIAYYKDTTLTLCTTKASEGLAAANGVAGGTIGAITSAQSAAGVFVFIQIGGIQLAVATDAAGTVAGDMLRGDGATDKRLVRTAAGVAPINVVFAIAQGAAAGGNNAATVRWILGQLLC